MLKLIEIIKKHHDYHKAGMILCHNGVVRETSRNGKNVKGLKLTVDHKKLDMILIKNRNRSGIIDIQVKIFENQDLLVGDDVMYLVVAGDYRENVISTLSDTLNEIKMTVTDKTEYYY